MDISGFAFLIGNLVGIALKRWPSFNNKFIPGAIFVVMLVIQFIKGAGGVVPAVSGGELHIAGFWDWQIVVELIAALKQTAYAVLVHQLRKQFGKA